ncbi:16S rRNA (cytosine(1402)-N(4))-methyltransferase RsmH, partial [Candidatus Peregrinibacteria bacterium]|nr:16S rRNA (cytosine(1402)-N(4))-methyltransferase RsmH [Candidatus Peregrinibacteria bacterium]
MEHTPVLRKDVQNYLSLSSKMTVVDATLGLGGHSKDILESVGESTKLIAFEQDERNLEEARKRLKKYEKQTEFVHDNFRNLKTRITELGITEIDAILFDLGLSSPHVDEAERGFSFMKEGPLDMRFDQRQKLTASDVINSYSEDDLARIFKEYG